MKRRSLFLRALCALTGGLVAREMPAARVAAPTSEIDRLFAADAQAIMGRIELDALARPPRLFALLHKDTLPQGIGFNWTTVTRQSATA